MVPTPVAVEQGESITAAAPMRLMQSVNIVDLNSVMPLTADVELAALMGFVVHSYTFSTQHDQWQTFVGRL